MAMKTAWEKYNTQDFENMEALCKDYKKFDQWCIYYLR